MPQRIRKTVVCVCCGQTGPIAGRGLRRSCYDRHWKRGELEQFDRERLHIEEHVEQFRAAHGPDRCWPWPTVNGSGYGRHQAVYEALVGPVPDGMELDHLCRVRACANPAHLEPVPRVVNLFRGNTLVRRNLSRTHCPQGHEYTAENTYVRAGTRYRDCLTCRKARTTARNQARRDGKPYVDPFRPRAVAG